jgi:hypothetical protein
MSKPPRRRLAVLIVPLDFIHADEFFKLDV